MAFARHLLRSLPSVGCVGLIPCAIGETSISDWTEGGPLWKNTIQRTKQALAEARHAHVAGLLWYGSPRCSMTILPSNIRGRTSTTAGYLQQAWCTCLMYPGHKLGLMYPQTSSGLDCPMLQVSRRIRCHTRASGTLPGRNNSVVTIVSGRTERPCVAHSAGCDNVQQPQGAPGSVHQRFAACSAARQAGNCGCQGAAAGPGRGALDSPSTRKGWRAAAHCLLDSQGVNGSRWLHSSATCPTTSRACGPLPQHCPFAMHSVRGPDGYTSVSQRTTLASYTCAPAQHSALHAAALAARRRAKEGHAAVAPGAPRTAATRS